MVTEPTKDAKYYGTYPIRNIGREQGIHMPAMFSGEYSIFSSDGGKSIILIRQGDRT
jgi:hypothetical protein